MWTHPAPTVHSHRPEGIQTVSPGGHGKLRRSNEWVLSRSSSHSGEYSMHPADYKRQGLWSPFPLDPRTNHGLLDSGVPMLSRGVDTVSSAEETSPSRLQYRGKTHYSHSKSPARGWGDSHLLKCLLHKHKEDLSLDPQNQQKSWVLEP